MELNISNQEFEKSILVFEFYSGIGGWHESFDLLMEQEFINTSLNCIFKVAFDINQNANYVYSLNHNDVKLETKSIEHLNSNYFDNILKTHFKEVMAKMQYKITSKEYFETKFSEWRNATKIIWTLSPPCQAFTRGGRQHDIDDTRSKSFVHILKKILPNLENQPDLLLLENVLNFEKSRMRDFMLQILKQNSYTYIEEYLLCLNRLCKWPNERIRYYMICSKNGSSHESFFSYNEPTQTINHLEFELSKLNQIQAFYNIKNIEDIVIDEYNTDESLYLDDEIIEKLSNYRFDIVFNSSNSSSCFTKGYGCKGNKFVKGSGPLLATKEINLNSQRFISDKDLLKQMKIRRLHSDEIKKALGFSKKFSLGELNQAKQRELLGNSVNVFTTFLIVLKGINNLYHFS